MRSLIEEMRSFLAAIPCKRHARDVLSADAGWGRTVSSVCKRRLPPCSPPLPRGILISHADRVLITVSPESALYTFLVERYGDPVFYAVRMGGTRGSGAHAERSVAVYDWKALEYYAEW